MHLNFSVLVKYICPPARLYKQSCRCGEGLEDIVATWYKHTLRIEYSFIIHGFNESCSMLFSFA